MKTEQEIYAILSLWQEAMVECENKMSRLMALFGNISETPFGDAISGLATAYTQSISEQIGWDYDTLVSWWIDHDYGAKPMVIGFIGEQKRSIKTLGELSAFIAEHLRREA